MTAPDPFGTAALRSATLDAWRRSPTRLREDAAAESDLRRGGYRDRVLTELAQNAADAASAAGVPGVLTVAVTAAPDGAAELRVANTGAPLDRDGVVTLCALRASHKAGRVGRFGVGFTAVTALAREAAVRSRSGGIVFSARRTRAALDEHALREPADGIPVLRLAWPDPTPPTTGDTEVVLRLDEDVDTAALLESMAAEAPELLLELPALAAITVGEHTWRRTDGPTPDAPSPDAPSPDVAEGARLLRRTIEDSAGAGRSWLEVAAPGVRWLVRLGDDGAAVPSPPDVLRAPTRSDEELSLPLLLIADVPMAPDRRRVMPEADLTPAARWYPALLRALAPDDRPALVPPAGFPRGPVDAHLRERIAAALRDEPWLPTVRGRDVPAGAAVLIPDLTPALAEVLGDTIDALLPPGCSGPRARTALAPLGVRELDAAGLAEALTGLDRPPRWWRSLYAALEPFTADSAFADGLGALPVPLADGRLVTGPRTVVVGDDLPVAGEGPAPSPPWARLAHPEAAHPLLLRLGATASSAHALLTDPALRPMLDDALDAALDGDAEPDAPGAPAGVSELAHAVLTLAGVVAASPAGADGLPGWLGTLPLPDADGEPRAADELLAPGAPLAGVLDDDAPFGALAAEVARRYGVDAVRAVGVGWGFTVVRDDAPTGPGHDLDDEDAWWAGLAGEPPELTAVRDLDLVHPDRWREALDLLAGDPALRPLLADRAGYTAWWLRRHARVDGVPVAALRTGDSVFPALLDPYPGPALPAGVPAHDTVDGPALAQVLVRRLSDPQRTPSPAEAVRAHRLLAEALARGAIALDDVAPPERVRAVDGTVVDAADALVLDLPWLAAAVPPSRLVVGDVERAAELAELLDVATASQAVRGEVVSPGRASTWHAEAGAVLAAVQTGLPLPEGPVVVHDALTVRVAVGDARPEEIAVPWWVDGDGAVHCDRTFARPVAPPVS